jgi:hypothetical protein
METTKTRPVEAVANSAALKLDSAALARLVDEVRNDAVSAPTAYNRVHNRHNR